MSAIEFCVNFKSCMYAIVDLIIFVFVLTCRVFSVVLVRKRTIPTGRSVGIVRLLTKTTEFSF
jgi:hypothetical protein